MHQIINVFLIAHMTLGASSYLLWENAGQEMTSDTAVTSDTIDHCDGEHAWRKKRHRDVLVWLFPTKPAGKTHQRLGNQFNH